MWWPSGGLGGLSCNGSVQHIGKATMPSSGGSMLRGGSSAWHTAAAAAAEAVATGDLDGILDASGVDMGPAHMEAMPSNAVGSPGAHTPHSLHSYLPYDPPSSFDAATPASPNLITASHLLPEPPSHPQPVCQRVTPPPPAEVGLAHTATPGHASGQTHGRTLGCTTGRTRRSRKPKAVHRLGQMPSLVPAGARAWARL